MNDNYIYTSTDTSQVASFSQQCQAKAINDVTWHRLPAKHHLVPSIISSYHYDMFQKSDSVYILIRKISKN